MKIYTKTGDKGQTRLVDGTCVEKFNKRVEAYGTIDELNSYLGLIHSQLTTTPQTLTIQIADFNLSTALNIIQNNLFIIGSLIATQKSDTIDHLPGLEKESIQHLEVWIDQMTEQLPELKNFILPTGHWLAAHTHVARTICRRAERRTAEALSDTPLINSPLDKQNDCLIYLNRLSDFLFTCARFINLQFGVKDILWKKK